jgi:hypothetical protein
LAVPSECAFSGGSITGVAHHSPLKSKTFEVLQMLKGAYHNGHFSAAARAELAIIPEWEPVDESTDGDDVSGAM